MSSPDLNQFIKNKERLKKFLKISQYFPLSANDLLSGILHTAFETQSEVLDDSSGN